MLRKKKYPKKRPGRVHKQASTPYDLKKSVMFACVIPRSLRNKLEKKLKPGQSFRSFATALLERAAK